MRKITSLMMLFCMFVSTALAQVLTVSNPPSNGEWDENTTWYVIQNKKGPYVSSAAGYVNADGYLRLDNNQKPTGDAALWCIVGNETDGYKFYNKSAGVDKVLSGSGELNAASKAVKMTDVSNPENRVICFDIANSQQSGYIVVKDHGSESNYLNHRENNLAYWNSTGATNDNGSSFLFVSEAEYASALATLNTSLTEARTLLSTSGLDYAAEHIALQASDPNAAGYISCPNLDPQEGSDMNYLIDDNPSTYIHTNWHSVSTTKDYFDIHLPYGLEVFQFSEITRSGASNDFPASIEILGSTDGQTYTTITTVSGLPVRAGASYTSPSIESDPSYTYLRFIITGSIYAANRPYWHMAEFDLYSLELAINDEYKDAMNECLALRQSIEEIQAVYDNANSDLSQLNAAAETLQALLLAVDKALNSEKYALAERIEELSAFLTLGGTTVGYYPAAKIETLSAAINTAQAVLDNETSVIADYVAALASLNSAYSALDLANSLLMPEEGKFYTIQNAYSSVYMCVSNQAGMKSTTEPSFSSVFTFVKGENGELYLKNVERGSYTSTAPIHAAGQASASAFTTEDAKAVVIRNLGVANRVSITPNGGTTLHHDVSYSNIVGWTGDANSRSAWVLSEVNIEDYSHTLTVDNSGWATLVLGYNSSIPAGVKVYAVSNVGADYSTLAEVTGAIPAFEPVLVNAADGNYEFKYAATASDVSENMLEGNVFDTNIGHRSYVLAQPAAAEGQPQNPVGFYVVKMDQLEGTAFKNMAFKAYLPIPSGAQANMLRFNIEGGETAIESIENANGEAKSEIFDLSGRRVANVQKGLYIVNGKKVIR